MVRLLRRFQLKENPQKKNDHEIKIKSKQTFQYK